MVLGTEENLLNNPIEFLLVEDNPGDIRLTQESLKDCKIAYHLSIVHNDFEAPRFLHREGEYRQAKTPDFILLSSNFLLGKDSSLLEQVKAEHHLSLTRIVVLTSSDEETRYLDRDLPIDLYLAKPFAIEKVVNIAQLGRQ